MTHETGKKVGGWHHLLHLGGVNRDGGTEQVAVLLVDEPVFPTRVTKAGKGAAQMGGNAGDVKGTSAPAHVLTESICVDLPGALVENATLVLGRSAFLGRHVV